MRTHLYGLMDFVSLAVFVSVILASCGGASAPPPQAAPRKAKSVLYAHVDCWLNGRSVYQVDEPVEYAFSEGHVHVQGELNGKPIVLDGRADVCYLTQPRLIDD